MAVQVIQGVTRCVERLSNLIPKSGDKDCHCLRLRDRVKTEQSQELILTRTKMLLARLS